MKIIQAALIAFLFVCSINTVTVSAQILNDNRPIKKPVAFFVDQVRLEEHEGGYKSVRQDGLGVGTTFERYWTAEGIAGNFGYSAIAKDNKLTLDYSSSVDDTKITEDKWRGIYAMFTRQLGGSDLLLFLSDKEPVTVNVSFNLSVTSQTRMTLNKNTTGLRRGGGSSNLLMLRVDNYIEAENDGGGINKEQNRSAKFVKSFSIKTNPLKYGTAASQWGAPKEFTYSVSIPQLVNDYFEQHTDIQSDPPQEKMAWSTDVLYHYSKIDWTTFNAEAKGHIEISVDAGVKQPVAKPIKKPATALKITFDQQNILIEKPVMGRATPYDEDGKPIPNLKVKVKVFQDGRDLGPMSEITLRGPQYGFSFLLPDSVHPGIVTVKASILGVPTPITDAQNATLFDVIGTLTPRDNFPNRSTTRLGVNEKATLGYKIVPTTVSPTVLSNLSWTKVSGNGAFTPNKKGGGQFQAGLTAGKVKFNLKFNSGPYAGATRSIQRDIVVPSTVEIRVDTSEPTAHIKGVWSIGFLGVFLIGPKDVSFVGLKIREGECKATATGWLKTIGLHEHKHEIGPSVELVKAYANLGNLGNRTDNVGIINTSGNKKYADGTFHWPIPVYWSADSKKWTKIGIAHQYFRSDKDGNAYAKKAGSDTVMQRLGDPTRRPNGWILF